MKAFDIRVFHPADMPMLYQICLETGASGSDATGSLDRDILGHIYAAPYVIFEPDLCFVLTLNGRACGYILGTSDSQQFANWCEAKWWPTLRQAYPSRGKADQSREASLIRMIHMGYPTSVAEDEYPAHLHIDILPQGQGQRLGARLIETFLERLQMLGVAGVHLGVGNDNKRAAAWYPRLGFHAVEESDTEITYAMRL